jgi:hypothetical protein
MIRQIIRAFIFVFVGWLLVLGLAALAENVSPDGSTTFLLIDQMHVNDVLSNRNDVEAMVLGSSHGDDIDFSTLNYRGYTLARAWGDLFETEYYLKYLVPKLPSLKVVFIPVSYFTFSWDNASVEKLDIRRTQMYTVIPAFSYIQGDIRNFLLGRAESLFPIRRVLREDNWSGVFNALRRGETHHGTFQELVENCDAIPEDKLDMMSSGRVADTIRSIQEIKANRPEIHEDTYRKAADITRYLQERGIRVVFFTPPYYSKYTQSFMQANPETIAIMEESMDRLRTEYGVEYYDHSRDEAFVNDFLNFKDSDHLNLCGKMMFSRVLLQKLSSAR